MKLLLMLIAIICFSASAQAESISIGPDTEGESFQPQQLPPGDGDGDGDGGSSSGDHDSGDGGDDHGEGAGDAGGDAGAGVGGSESGPTVGHDSQHDAPPPPPPPPNQQCPNLFPSWLPDSSTPTCRATTYSVPWIDTEEYQASAANSLLAPSGDYFVSCNGAQVVDEDGVSEHEFGASQQELVSSTSGSFGGDIDVEFPCQVLPTSQCLPYTPTPLNLESKIATATANAYVSLDAFNSYFSEKHSWQGFGNDGLPINAEFGNDFDIFTHGWNSRSQSVTFCPGAIYHINVWAHELFHGIVEATTQFEYNNYSSSGGIGAREINEAYADYFAEMVQFHAGINDTSSVPGMPGDYRVSYGKNNWGAGSAFYDQKRPCHSDPRETQSSSSYYTNGGPIRHMMYLLAEGTDPAILPHSDVCQGPAVLEGIGRDEASNVWFDALVSCDWRADGEGLNHCDARRCTLEAATCGTVREAVRGAWDAVELTAEACGVVDEILPECPTPPLEY